MYRTGDLGRYTSEGIVECTGRADDQVLADHVEVIVTPDCRSRSVDFESSWERSTRILAHTSKSGRTEPSSCAIVTKRNASCPSLCQRCESATILITDSISQVADEFDLDSIRAHLVEKLPHYAVPSSEF